MNEFFIISIIKMLDIKFVMMCLQLVSKSTILVTIDVMYLHGTIVEMTSNIQLQNGFKSHMQLWLAITINLNENENVKCNHIIHD